jgi:DNA-directed RNA polymerase alpha subunit
MNNYRTLSQWYEARHNQLTTEYYQTFGMLEAMIRSEKNQAVKARLAEVYVRMAEGRNRIEAVNFEAEEIPTTVKVITKASLLNDCCYDIGLSTRALVNLRKMGIVTVEQLMNNSIETIMALATKNFGARTLDLVNEVKNKLQEVVKQ